MSPDVFERLSSQEDVELAKVAQRALGSTLAHSDNVSIALVEEGATGKDTAQILKLPQKALRLFADMLGALGQDRAIAIMALETYVSTQEAAMFLNVSRPYLVRLLDEGKLPSTQVGKHRRIKFEDVLTYKEVRRKSAQATLQELVAQAQKSGTGY